MVIDTSALLAILFDEPERRAFNVRIEAATVRVMSAASWLETAIIIDDRRGYEGARDLQFLISAAGIEILPVDLDQAQVARDAYRRFGRGNHRAALNYGDSFAYALAKLRAEPLLFKGGDFGLTDVEPAS
jgi:ribonuclease VapC